MCPLGMKWDGTSMCPLGLMGWYQYVSVGIDGMIPVCDCWEWFSEMGWYQYLTVGNDSVKWDGTSM